MNPDDIILRYYQPGSLAFEVLTTHSRLVTEKALIIARRVPELDPDLQFVAEAAMLHDLGIFLTNAPKIGCHGEDHYLMHGPLGRTLLEELGYPRHALVCDRHTGVGLTGEDIRSQGLPLPDRDMTPISIEEQIICYADTFYSKNPAHLTREKSVEHIRLGLEKFGPAKTTIFDDWVKRFGI